jgi:DNA-binding transcriptional LysR family regulator
MSWPTAAPRTMAEAGHGTAIVPSTVRFVAKRIRVLPLVHQGRSLGAWAGVVWDPRRTVPAYATAFIEGLAADVSRTFPGKRFDHFAPPVPRPPRAADGSA